MKALLSDPCSDGNLLEEGKDEEDKMHVEVPRMRSRPSSSKLKPEVIAQPMQRTAETPLMTNPAPLLR